VSLFVFSFSCISVNVLVVLSSVACHRLLCMMIVQPLDPELYFYHSMWRWI
jgi:hypothetical protein